MLWAIITLTLRRGRVYAALDAQPVRHALSQSVCAAPLMSVHLGRLWSILAA